MSPSYYEFAFAHSSTSLWIEDISDLRREIAAIRQATSDFPGYIEKHPEFVRRAASLIQVIDVNNATLSIYEENDKSALLGPLEKTMNLDDPVVLASIKWNVLAIAAGENMLTRASVASTPSGRRIEVLISVHIPPESEPTAPMLVELTDVTEKRKLERSVGQDRSLLRTVINSIPDFIYMKDLEHRFTLVNRALVQALGADSPSDVLGKRDRDYYSAEFEKTFVSDEREVMFEGRPLVDKLEQTVLPTGGLRWVLTTKLPLRDDGGNIVGLVGLGKDITAWRETEGKLRAFIDQSTEAIWVVGEDGRVVEFNSSAERLTGLRREEAIGTPSWELMGRITMPDRWNKEIETRMRAEMRRAIETGASGFLDKPLTSSLRRPDGQIRHFEHFYFPIRTRDGHQIGAIAHDITDVRNVRETLRRLETQLQQAQKMEAVGQLAGGVAHEFNNILTTIMGYSSILRSETETNPAAQQLIDSIVKAARRASHVTDGILVFSRRGKGALRTVDLNEIVDREVLLLRRLVGPRLEIRNSRWGDPVPVRADLLQIEQMLMNLATNARDATDGAGRIDVVLRCEQLDEGAASESVNAVPGPYAHLEFADNGSGMDRPIRDRIFEPFFSTKAVGKGSGLGLSIVWGIVDQHGGFIKVESAPGQGTTFHIYFPLTDSPLEPLPPVEELPAVRGEGTVLIAEGDEILRRFAVAVLTEAGYTVREASSGDEAVAIFRRRIDEIDLLIFDAADSQADGNRSLSEIVRLQPDVTTLFVSGYSAHGTSGAAGLPDDAEIIHKPFTAASLLDRVKNVLS